MLMQSGSFFSLACGESVLQSALIFSEEVRCCKWKLSIGFIYPLFFLPPLFTSLIIFPSLLLLRSKRHPPLLFFRLLLSLSLFTFIFSLPPFVPFFHFFPVFSVSHFHSVAVPLSPSLSLSPSLCRSISPSLSCVLCFFVLCSRRPLDKQDSTFASQRTVHHHHHSALRKTPATCSRLPLPPFLAPPLHFESCRRQAAVG